MKRQPAFPWAFLGGLFDSPLRARLGLTSIIFLVGFYTFQDFLLFKKLYVFCDIGADSLYYGLPQLISANRLVHDGTFPAWTFGIGAGQSLFAMNQQFFDVFHWILLAANKDTFLYWIPYVLLLKSLTSGLFFHAYLQRMGISPYARFLGAILYAFNGYIILWGQHYGFSTACAYLAIVLWATEGWIQERRWIPFVLSLFLLSMWSYYSLFMIGIFLVLYVQIRFLVNSPGRKQWLRLNCEMGALAILGLGLACFAFLPAAYTVLTSARVRVNSQVVFGLDHPSYYLSLLSRFFSNHVSLDAGRRHFYDWWNYYEAPNVYTGLLTLILVPFGCHSKKKNRFLIIAALGLILMFLIIPFFSSLMNGFSYVSYRWTYVITPVLLLASMNALTRLERGSGISSARLGIAALVLIALFLLSLILAPSVFGWPRESLWSGMRENASVVIFLAGYFLLLMGIQREPTRHISKGLLLVLIAIEASVHSRVDTHQRCRLEPEYITERRGVFDESLRAVDFLRKSDPDFYRIGKAYNGASWNDPIAQGYHGTSAYISINHASYLAFLKAWNVTYPNLNVTRIPFDRFRLSTLLAVKYYLAHQDSDVPFGYRAINRFGPLRLFKNEYALPFGIAFDSYVLAQDFHRLSEFDKDRISLESVILEEGASGISDLKHTPVRPPDRLPETKRVKIEPPLVIGNIDVSSNQFPQSFEGTSTFSDPYIEMKFARPISGQLRIAFEMRSERAVTAQFMWRSGGGIFLNSRAQYAEIHTGLHNYEVDLGYLSQVDRLRFELANLPGRYLVRRFAITVNEVNNDAKQYETAVERLKRDALNVTLHNETEIEGTMALAKKKMAVFGIPFDRGWHATVNGRKTPIERVNAGFSGLLLPAGAHVIRFTYQQPYLFLGLVLSGLSVLVFAILARQPRKEGFRFPRYRS